MSLIKKAVQLYKSIDYYDRYKSLSDDFSEEKFMDKQDKNQVMEILGYLGYSAKYFGKEKFYQILEETEECEFYFHTSLKYGACEIVFGGTSKSSNEHVGGTAAAVCKDIENATGHITDGYIKKPWFSNYEELKEILVRALQLYEDFKVEFEGSKF